MANSLKFQIHGPGSAPLAVTVEATDDATPDQWLGQFESWMREKEVRDLPFGRGMAHVDFSQVWAVTYELPLRPPTVH